MNGHTTNQDYDLFLYDNTMTSLYSSSARNHQSISLSPIELLQSGAQGCLVVASDGTTENHHLHIYTLGGSINGDFAISEGSISTPADAIHSITAGAIHYSSNTLEPFSSYGPTDDGRQKPDICGFDGVSSGQNRINPFYGTSAAAPHVSGGIALFLEVQTDTNMLDAITIPSQYANQCGAGILSLEEISSQYKGVSSTNGKTNTGDNTTSPDQSTQNNPSSTSTTTAITLSSVGSPANGTAIINQDDTITYSPNLNHYGVDSFSYTITDGSLYNTGTVTINVIGVNDPPVLDAISDYTIHENSTGTITISATDPERPPILSATLPEFATISDHFDGTGSISLNPGFADSGNYSISVIATDADDNTLFQTENFVLLVNNTNRAPVISAINDIAIPMIEMYSLEIPASDPDGDEIAFSATGLPTGSAINGTTGLFSWAPSEIQEGLFTFRVIATEKNSTALSGNGTVSITVTDSISPIITPPNDIILEATNIFTLLNSTHYGEANATDNVDTNITITNNATMPFGVGVHTIEWRATDDAKNNSTATQIITIQDTTPPVITPPNDITLEATSLLTMLNSTHYGEATVMDIFETTISNNATNTFALGSHTIMWNATDANNNTSTIQQNIILQDTTPPVIDILGESLLIQEYGIPYEDAGATATDTVHGNLTNSIISQNSINIFVVGNYIVTYSATDHSNNIATAIRNITVSDTQVPLLLLIGNHTQTIQYGYNYADAGATAADPIDGNITNSITTENPVDTRIVGNYTITYAVSDKHQNQAESITRNVTVQDTVPPIINISNSLITLERGTPYIGGVRAFDPVDGDITSSIVSQNTVDVNNIGNYTILYDVTDVNGNKAEQKSVIVTVQDTNPPTADAGNDVTVPELSTISLDGTASHDGPYPISYQWNNTSVFPVNILNDTSATPSIIISKTDVPQIIPFEVIVSDGANQSTDIVNILVETKPRIVISTELYQNGIITTMNNATYTITPHPYTGNNSMIIHQEMIDDSQYSLEKLNANYTDINFFKQLYYAGDLAADDVLPGMYNVTISEYGTASLLEDSVTLYAENSHVSIASFVSYDDILGDIKQAIMVPPPDINTNGTSAITKFKMIIGK